MLNSLKQVRAALGLLSPDEVRKMAERPVHIGLVAATDAGYSEMEEFLAPLGMPADDRVRALQQIHRATEANPPANVDFVLYEHGITPIEGAVTFDRQLPGEAVSEILYRHHEISLALGRQFPAFRATVIHRVVMAVARENAFFALATALPDVIPNLAEIPWSIGEFASDTAFLTTNQIRMAFLIAAAHGRDIGFLQQKAAVLSILGSAFGWRALARELAGKIPFGGGLIPKAAISYAGTFVVGKALERVYEGGIPFTREEHEAVYKDAYQQGSRVAESLRKPA